MAAIIVCHCAVTAQEPLSAVAARGYGRQWLAAGPFPFTTELPLNRGRDFLTWLNRFPEPPFGLHGEAAPDVGELVQADGLSRPWQRIETSGPWIPAPLASDGKGPGIVYFRSSIQSDTNQPLYLDLQAPMGARLWLNGYALQSGAMPGPGIPQRFVAMAQTGLNTIVVQAPVAAREDLNQHLELNEDVVDNLIYHEQPLLKNTKGAGIALRILPAQLFGGIAVVPRLEPGHVFTTPAGQRRQNAYLTIFNPSPSATAPISLTVAVPGAGSPMEKAIPGIPGYQQHEASIDLPVYLAEAGQPMTVEILFNVGGAMKTLALSFSSAGASDSQPVVIGNGLGGATMSFNNQREETAWHLLDLERRFALARQEPSYGFLLDDTALWLAWLQTAPKRREEISKAVIKHQILPQAGYTPIAEGLVTGEVLLRNLLYGIDASQRNLGFQAASYRQENVTWWTDGDLWGNACPPQLPQILRLANVKQLLSTGKERSSICPVIGLDGSVIEAARYMIKPAPDSVGEFDELMTASLDLDSGIPSLLTFANESPGPEAFLANKVAALSQRVPPIRFLPALDEVFDAMDAGAIQTYAPHGAAFDIVTVQPEIKAAYASTETALLSAEKSATFARLLGYSYPAEEINHLWRQLLFCAAPGRLGRCESTQEYVDALASMRGIHHDANSLLDSALVNLAVNIDTARAAPPGKPNARPVVVFNPCAWERFGMVEAALPPGFAGALTILDDGGRRVPCQTIAHHGVTGVATPVAVEFMARDMPALGYRTYYAVEEGSPSPESSPQPGAQIENEYFRIIADPARGGALISLYDKISGTEYAAPMLNDLLAMEMAQGRTRAGNVLTTVSRVARASEEDAIVEITTSETGEHLSAASAFAGGQVIRTVTLRHGQRRIDCSVRFEGTFPTSTLLAVEFRTNAANTVPVLGAAYGSVAGSLVSDLSQAQPTVGDTGMNTALHWAALSANDGIRVGREASIPLGPARIVRSPDNPVHERLAHDLQAALAKRGIASEVARGMGGRGQGAALDIFIGSPDQNPAVEALFKDFTAPTFARFQSRLAQGATLLIDGDLRPGSGPPALIVAAQNDATLERLIENMEQSLATTGAFNILPADFLSTTPRPPAAHGFAVLYPGTRAWAMDGHGNMIQFLERQSVMRDDLALAEDKGLREYRYALVPFDGDWREAGIPREATAYTTPLYSAATELHTGTLPGSESFLDVSGDDFEVTAVHAAGQIDSTGAGSPPAHGIVVRGYETSGRNATVTFTSSAALREARRNTASNPHGNALEVTSNRIAIDASPFEMASLTLFPGVMPPVENTDAVETPAPLFARPWLHNEGDSQREPPPFRVFIHPTSSAGSGSFSVTVVNISMEQPVAGDVVLTPVEDGSVVPRDFSFALAPGGFESHDVTVLPPSGREPALLVEARQGNASVYDVYQPASPLECEAYVEEGNIIAVIRNAGTLPLLGRAALVVPSALWPENRPARFTGAVPHEKALKIAPFSEERIVFRVRDEVLPPWAVLKAAGNGHTSYMKTDTR